MPRSDQKPFEQVVEDLGRYPVDAFEFLREGLKHTVVKVHGEPSQRELQIQEWMARYDVPFDKLSSLYEAGELPDEVMQAVEQVGGPARLNRHVTGRDLCNGLRDLAVEKWGLMASTVLARWNIHSTEDFGHIVFALVKNDYLQKQPDDAIEDFMDVYDFDEAFDQTYRFELADT